MTSSSDGSDDGVDRSMVGVAHQLSANVLVSSVTTANANCGVTKTAAADEAMTACAKARRRVISFGGSGNGLFDTREEGERDEHDESNDFGICDGGDTVGMVLESDRIPSLSSGTSARMQSISNVMNRSQRKPQLDPVRRTILMVRSRL